MNDTERPVMAGSVSCQYNPEQMVYFHLNCTVQAKIVARVEKFILDGSTGNVRLNIKDGVILGVHCEDITTVKAPSPRRRTA